MTPAQLVILKTAIQAETAPEFVALRIAGATGAMAGWFNQPAAPDFFVWRTSVTAEETGNAWQGTDIDGMSSLNMQRLQLLLASSPSGVFDMSRSDRRAGFENPFGAVNNASRVAMRAVWKRKATRGERLFTTGVGSDASPGALSFEGDVGNDDIIKALSL